MWFALSKHNSTDYKHHGWGGEQVSVNNMGTSLHYTMCFIIIIVNNIDTIIVGENNENHS